MALGPILPGRIPSTLVSKRLQEYLTINNQILSRLQDQIATGQKFFLPSESPAAAARTILLQSILERQQQLETNTTTNGSLLEASEASLDAAGDALNKAKAFLLAGVGDSTSTEEKAALALEVATLVQSTVNAANSTFRGRYLFGGSQSLSPPFEIASGGAVLYRGDTHQINSYLDNNFLLANNVDGNTAFGALTTKVGSDLDPALTLSTRVSDLLGGKGVTLGSIVVTLDDGVNPVETATIDLSQAETINDIKTLVENAFAAQPVTLTMSINPLNNSGIRLTPSAGTITVNDLPGATVAADLGIKSATPAAVINGGDLDPQLTRTTTIAALNDGTGIGVTAGNGLYVVNGTKTAVIDISSATTVEDLFNLIELAGLDLHAEINAAGNGLAISSRLSGVDFTIGENNGQNATLLGIRTMTAGTLLSDLNGGRGVPVSLPDPGGGLLPAPIDITRRNGTTISIDLQGLSTVQDVLDAINAVDPGVLNASLNAVGNGISIVDTSGVGPLSVAANDVSIALGIDGTEPGAVNTVPLVGKDVNPVQSNGVLSLLVQLQRALEANDQIALARLDPLFEQEIGRFNLVRGELGTRMKAVEDVQNRLLDSDIALHQALSDEFDIDITTAVTQVAELSNTLQATLSAAARILQLNLLDYL